MKIGKKNVKNLKKKIIFISPKIRKLKKKNTIFTEKYAIFLVLPIAEISLWPEHSSLPCFRMQGGYPERDWVVEVGVAGQYFP